MPARENDAVLAVRPVDGDNADRVPENADEHKDAISSNPVQRGGVHTFQ